MKAIAQFSVRHRLLVIAVWVLAVIGVQAVASSVGDDYRNEFVLAGTDSQDALDLLEDEFPAASGESDRIVWQVESGSVTDPAVRERIEPLLAEVASNASVQGVESPYSAQGAPQISADGRTAYATVQYVGVAVELERADIEELVDSVETAQADGLQVAVGGQGVATLSQPEVGLHELVGLAFAAAVLLLAFGSLIAMALPLVSAMAALGVGIGVVALLSNTVVTSDVAPVLGILLGLGVGIDYALFIVNRYRGNLLAGRGVEAAVVASINTSGRAVVFAGVVVCIALAGIFVVGVSFLNGLAIGAGTAVVFTVLASVTLLPALLGLLGTRVLGRRARSRMAAGDVVAERSTRVFGVWARLVQRRPAALGLVGVVVLAVIAIPTLDLRLGAADQGNDPAGTTTRESYDLLAEGFGPGFNGPLLVVTDLSENPVQLSPDGAPGPDEATGAPPQAPPQLSGLLADLQADPGVADVAGPRPNDTGTAAVFSVTPTTSPQDEATSDLVQRIRDDYAPAAAAQDVTLHVGGPVATFDDFADEIADALPLFFGVVIGLSFIVLVIAFRSLVIPTVAALLNLLSAAAAFGVVVAVFQWGWAADLVGVGSGGPIEPFIPVVLFALLFGLSTDYQVFLVSRISEEWHPRRDNGAAVRIGHADTGRVIVAAASIMIFVFGGFVLGDSRTIKLLGLGMAAAVLIDAFLIRMLVVPAVMHRLGAANWWLPAWLERVTPRLSVEANDDASPLPDPERDPMDDGRQRRPAASASGSSR